MGKSKWAWLFVLLMLGLTVSSWLRTIKHDLDFQVFYRVGLQFLQGDYDFYNLKRYTEWPFRYGPLFPPLMVPFALMEKELSQLVWGLLNALAFPFAWWLSERVLCRRMDGRWIRHPATRLLSLLAVIDVVTRNAAQGNINMFMFLLMISAIDLQDRRHSFAAGLAAALGFVIKIFPGAAIGYFLLSRSYRAFFWSVGLSIALGWGVPGLIYGFPETSVHFQNWIALLGDNSSYPFLKYVNQAPYAVFLRITNGAEILSKAFAACVLLSVAVLSLYYAYKKKDLMILITQIVLPMVTLTCVFTEYHLILLPVFMVGTALMVSQNLSKAWQVAFWFRFAWMHLAVLAIVGRTATEVLGAYGNQLFGMLLLLWMIACNFQKLRAQA